MKFKQWCQEKWYEHLDEYLTLGQPIPKYNIKEYFNKYKYWLKREYKHERQRNFS